MSQYESFISAALWEPMDNAKYKDVPYSLEAVRGMSALEDLLKMLRVSNAKTSEYWPAMRELARLIGTLDALRYLQDAGSEPLSDPPRSSSASGQGSGCQPPPSPKMKQLDIFYRAANGTEDYGWGV